MKLNPKRQLDPVRAALVFFVLGVGAFGLFLAAVYTLIRVVRAALG